MNAVDITIDEVLDVEPRLKALQTLVEALHQADGQIPWAAVDALTSAFLGARRAVVSTSPPTAAAQRVTYYLRDERLRQAYLHRLRGTTPGMYSTGGQ